MVSNHAEKITLHSVNNFKKEITQDEIEVVGHQKNTTLLQGNRSLKITGNLTIEAKNNMLLQGGSGKIQLSPSQMTIAGAIVGLNSPDTEQKINAVIAEKIADGYLDDAAQVKPHWLKLKLTDPEDSQNPVPNYPYEVTLKDGSKKTGQLDEKGEAHFETVFPGTAAVKYGNIEQDQSDLTQTRQQLQTTLNQIVAQITQEAAKERQQFVQDTTGENIKLWAAHLTADVPLAIRDTFLGFLKSRMMINSMANVGAAMEMENLAAIGMFNSNDPELLSLFKQAETDYLQTSQEMAASLARAYKTIKLIFCDKPTHEMLHHFMQQCWDKSTALQKADFITKQMTMILVMILATVAVKNMGIIADAFASCTAAFRSLLEDAGKILEKLAGILDKIRKDVEDEGETNAMVVSEAKRVELDEAIASAKKIQTKYGYNPDTFEMKLYPKGQRFVGGLPGQSGFYTTEDSLMKSGFSRTKLFKGLQVEPHPILGYRPKVGIYELQEDANLPTGIVRANEQFGEGGLNQIVNEHFSQNLKLIKEINLGE